MQLQEPYYIKLVNALSIIRFIRNFSLPGHIINTSLTSLLSRAFSDNFFVTPQLISYPSTRTLISPPIIGVRGQTNTISDTPFPEAHDDPIINSI